VELKLKGISLSLVAGVVALIATASTVHAADNKPNIVHIAADDLGWKDVGFNGATEIKTPNIDKLAAAGAKFTQFYVQPMCTPTRAALMTGRYPFRYGLQTAVIPSVSAYGLEILILPNLLEAPDAFPTVSAVFRRRILL
jgi:arylsulfatase B